MLLGIVVVLGPGARAGEPSLVGRAAPALTARLFDGSEFNSAAERGHVVLLNFWASWCAPCRAEMPALEELAMKHQAQGLVVVGLSADDRHDRRAAEEIARKFRYRLGMLEDARQNGFGAPRALPQTYVIGADGTVTAVLRGGAPGSLAELQAAVEAALAAAR